MSVINEIENNGTVYDINDKRVKIKEIDYNTFDEHGLPQQADLEDIVQNKPQLIHLYNIWGMADQYFILSNVVYDDHDSYVRVAYLNTDMDSETFSQTALIFDKEGESDAEIDVHDYAAEKVITVKGTLDIEADPFVLPLDGDDLEEILDLSPSTFTVVGQNDGEEIRMTFVRKVGDSNGNGVYECAIHDLDGSNILYFSASIYENGGEAVAQYYKTKISTIPTVYVFNPTDYSVSDELIECGEEDIRYIVKELPPIIRLESENTNYILQSGKEDDIAEYYSIDRMRDGRITIVCLIFESDHDEYVCSMKIERFGNPEEVEITMDYGNNLIHFVNEDDFDNIKGNKPISFKAYVDNGGGHINKLLFTQSINEGADEDIVAYTCASLRRGGSGEYDIMTVFIKDIDTFAGGSELLFKTIA